MSEYRCDTETIVPDAGYFFGLGVFETIAVEEGRPLFLDRHLARLQKGLDFLGLDQTVEPAAVRTYLKLLPAIVRRHGVLKITVSEKKCALHPSPKSLWRCRFCARLFLLSV